MNEDFGFSLLDVRPKMTNWSEIRKVTDWAHWQNWLQFRVNTEAVCDRAKVPSSKLANKIFIKYIFSLGYGAIQLILG